MQNAADMDMTFEAFYEIYTKDMKARLKENSWITKALDNYHRLNNTNARLYQENEHLTAVNDQLTGENAALRSELKDCRFLRKLLSSQQIGNLIAQAQEMEQQRKQNQRTKHRNSNYER